MYKHTERWLLSEDGMVSKTEDHGAILVDNALRDPDVNIVINLT